MSAFASARPGVNPYLQTQVQSRTPIELVVMLYDGAIRFTTEARAAVVAKDIARRGNAVSRAMAILSELQSTLDLEKGGDIAVNLDKLYTFIRDRLVDASIKQDVRPLDEALRVLTTLREGWSGISTGPLGAR
jgi:flagellar secretion chaperone FliS